MARDKQPRTDCDDEDYLLSSEKEETKEVSYFKLLFSFATLKDYLLVTFGVLAAIVSGFDCPVYLVLYGDIANVMVYMNVTEINNTLNDNSTQCHTFPSDNFILR